MQKVPLDELASQLSGELHRDELMRTLYATDASAYQVMPLAVAIPADDQDLCVLIQFAEKHSVSLIPRTAGTSLAGQVVGDGIVVDVSRTFTRILEIKQATEEEPAWVRVQPGVIRNELNQALHPHGLMFGPETSTQNRAMLGGMLGNNSCGSNSIKYGSVRDQILEVTALLSDGSKVTFGPLNNQAFQAKCEGGDSLETRIYRDARTWLSDAEIRNEIIHQFPKTSIPRRNTGYALDELMDASCFDPSSSKPFNFAKLIAGSEGTLCLVLEMKLRCDPLPPPIAGLQCAQFESVDASLRAAQLAVKYDCYAVEVIDHFILDCTKRSIEHRKNRFFLEGEPAAVLVTEIRGETEAEVRSTLEQIERDFRDAQLGYAYPILFGQDMQRIWELRKAGLGLLSNEPGDTKPVAVIEDTAVDVADLADYIAEFDAKLSELGLECVHFAHAGSGEIHLRPYIDLKTAKGHEQFRRVASEVADLVKKYQGSLSGEHGDGRLRGEFISRMVGERNYELFRKVKRSWDPNSIFNPGKIVDTPPMDTSLRYQPDQGTPELPTVFDWSRTKGIVRAAEMCNGSGDCRKTHLAGGTMCPSYMATRNEKDTTRGRANMLRNVLTSSTKENRFDSEELKDVMDLCLSCKGCKNECPSTVDMAKLKAEFQQHYYDANGVPFRSRIIANFVRSQQYVRWAPWAWNFVFSASWLRKIANRLAGFHPDRTIPLAPTQTLEQWFRTRSSTTRADRTGTRQEVILLNDEFTNYVDMEVGQKSVELLERLGYRVRLETYESGRTWLSKGLLRNAKTIVTANVQRFSKEADSTRFVGLEPSAILTFRDEVPELVDAEHRVAASRLAESCFTFEEFMAREVDSGNIGPDHFTDDTRRVHLHGHCFQKALIGTSDSVKALSLPKNFTVEVIPSGCCGMAGSFGYEKEHYDLSMKIAELVLLPAVRRADKNEFIAASGTSCRHQIHDGANRRALHPAEILHAALK